jgi:hypothetical protein
MKNYSSSSYSLEITYSETKHEVSRALVLQQIGSTNILYIQSRYKMIKYSISRHDSTKTRRMQVHLAFRTSLTQSCIFFISHLNLRKKTQNPLNPLCTHLFPSHLQCTSTSPYTPNQTTHHPSRNHSQPSIPLGKYSRMTFSLRLNPDPNPTKPYQTQARTSLSHLLAHVGRHHNVTPLPTQNVMSLLLKKPSQPVGCIPKQLILRNSPIRKRAKIS